MARGRKRIVDAKDYDALIQATKENIEKMTSDLKEEKAKLKVLEKDAVAYAKQLEEEKKKAELDTISKMIVESGKTLDEIKELLSK